MYVLMKTFMAMYRLCISTLYEWHNNMHYFRVHVPPMAN